MNSVMVSGFSNFGEVADNPSLRLAHRLAQEIATGAIRTVMADASSLSLPVSYARAGQVLEAALTLSQPDLLLMLGVAQTAAELRLETTARGVRTAHAADSDGTAGLPSEIELPEPLHTTLDAVRIAERLAGMGHPVTVSHDAGGYVCDSTYHAALNVIHRLGLKTQCLFVHVPADEGTFAEPAGRPVVRFDVQLAALRALVAVLAEAP